MGKENVKSFIEQAPRWLLVILAGAGLLMMKQRFEAVEQAVKNHDKELQELRLISAKLTAVVEIKREHYERNN